MKAAVFRGLGNPLAMETVVDPEIRNGEVLLKVAYCGICGSDLHATAEGVFVVPDGTVLGHEFSGEVVESADAAPTADALIAIDKWTSAGMETLARWKALQADLAAVNVQLEKAKLQPLTIK